MTLIVYEDSAKAGRFEEERVLTFFEGEFQRFEWLGTEEGNAALNEFKARSKRRKKGVDGDELFGDDVFVDA